MRWSNVRVIFRREVRDQLRDRRTLFMVVVLPILLYPMLGIGIAQLSVSFEQKPRTVVLVGIEALPERPGLLDDSGERFDRDLFDTPAEADRLVVRPERRGGPWDQAETARAAIRAGLADAAVLIPPDLVARLGRDEDASDSLQLLYDSADERSQITYLRLREVLDRWETRVVDARLERDRKPANYTNPIRVKAVDVATPAESGGSVWARIFPFLLVMMSLTGAFYPAIDLCAGEKERGTMETLLISPASRAEIVVGKFLTVMLASVSTALLNILSMGLTGAQLAHQMRAIAPSSGRAGVEVALAPPSLASAGWMIVLLIPLAAFFSAVCLALAVLAKSMKEGQYYMTPLYLVSLPLIFLSLAPGIELDLFYSLVPITGVALLLKALMQGEYGVARQFFLPVLLPTILYGVVALRWAIDQFKRESVLFRESERFDLRGWLRHLLRDKEPTPTAGEALFCFVMMLTSAWFLMQVAAVGNTAVGMAVAQFAFILAPPLAMGVLLTSRPRRTLRLTWPSGRYLGLAAGLALAFNPLINEFGVWIDRLFPVPEAIKAALNQLIGRDHDPLTLLVVLALVPAVCEEVAFRGYILSGLERAYRRGTAILLSALLFGFLHVLLSLFQQFFNATLLGLVLGLLAVRSGSLLPGIVFHLINNALAVLRTVPTADLVGPGLAGRLDRANAAGWLYRDAEQGLYHWPWLVLGGLVATALIVALVRRGRKAPTAGLEHPEALVDAAAGR